jgi:ribosomal protein S18 acetylase RimI-like enzyme
MKNGVRLEHVTPIMITSMHLGLLKIRTINMTDLTALEWDGEYTSFRQMFREIYQNSCKGKMVVWVADLSKIGLIGQVFIQLNSSNTNLSDGNHRAYIFGFRVKQAFQGLGVGSELLVSAEADLKQRNYSWVNLNVGKNNHKTQCFYEKRGYYFIGEDEGRWSYLDEDGQCHDVHEPSWRMEKHFT